MASQCLRRNGIRDHRVYPFHREGRNSLFFLRPKDINEILAFTFHNHITLDDCCSCPFELFVIFVPVR